VFPPPPAVIRVRARLPVPCRTKSGGPAMGPTRRPAGPALHSTSCPCRLRVDARGRVGDCRDTRVQSSRPWPGGRGSTRLLFPLSRSSTFCPARACWPLLVSTRPRWPNFFSSLAPAKSLLSRPHARIAFATYTFAPWSYAVPALRRQGAARPLEQDSFLEVRSGLYRARRYVGRANLYRALTFAPGHRAACSGRWRKPARAGPGQRAPPANARIHLEMTSGGPPRTVPCYLACQHRGRASEAIRGLPPPSGTTAAAVRRPDAPPLKRRCRRMSTFRADADSTGGVQATPVSYLV